MPLILNSTLSGTSSNAVTASYARTASFVDKTVDSASFALTASYVSGAISVETGSLVSTSSFNEYTSSRASKFAGTASLALTASFLSGSIESASYAATASHAITASIAMTASFLSGSIESASYAATASLALTASFLSGSIQSASYAATASLAISASYTLTGVISITGSTLYSQNAGPNVSTTDGIYIGRKAGEQASGSDQSIMLGLEAGALAYGAQFSTFIGKLAGKLSDNATNVVAIGESAGADAKNAILSNFIGAQAGRAANEVANSNFIGSFAGNSAKSASYSNLIGYQVGYNTTAGDGIGVNNTIIGTNITLDNERRDSINIGGIIFGSGSYSNTSGNPFSGSANGRIGINKVEPSATLDIVGNSLFTGSMKVTSNVEAASFTGSYTGSLTGTWNNSGSHTFLHTGSTGADQSMTGSFRISGSIIHIGSATLTGSISGSFIGNAILTGSYSGSLTGTWNNTGSAAFLHTGSENTIQTFTGSLNFLGNLTVTGTASFTSVTASSVLVNQNTITVYANSTASLPKAGYLAVDTASISNSGSLLYDVTATRWESDRNFYAPNISASTAVYIGNGNANETFRFKASSSALFVEIFDGSDWSSMGYFVR